MFSRAATTFSPTSTQVRGMATLKAISMRLKAVTNIQKITKSMKMVSAAKFAKAERELRPAKAYGTGVQAFVEKSELEQDQKKQEHLLVALTSDRGLCGGVHSAVAKAIRAKVEEKPDGMNFKIVAIGDKSRAMLGRRFPNEMLMQFNDIGKSPPTFGDAAVVANEIINCGYEFDVGEIYFNIFRTVISYRTTNLPLFTLNQLSDAPKIALYDSVDEEVLRSYNEFSLASLVFYAMKEAAATEQSQRMSAMDNATKNAGEMIDKLTMTFNRTRQAVITRELIEIISGAAALE